MATGNWWFKFEWKDWRDDPKLRRCSLETQGFWINCLCVMHAAGVAELSGSPDELARLIGCFSEELMRCVIELKKTNTADVIIGNGDVSIKSRRRQNELNAKEYNRLQVQKHRQKVICNGNVMVQSKSKSKSKKKDKEEEIRAEAAPTETVAFDSIWDEFLALLIRQGSKEAGARSKIGLLIKKFGKEKISACYADTKERVHASNESYAYFLKTLQAYKFTSASDKHLQQAKAKHHAIFGHLDYPVEFKPEEYGIEH